MPTEMSSGTAELNAVIVPGDSKLPCYQMYEELQTIKELEAGLTGHGRCPSHTLRVLNHVLDICVMPSF